MTDLSQLIEEYRNLLGEAEATINPRTLICLLVLGGDWTRSKAKHVLYRVDR